MARLVLCTGNAGKIAELKALLPSAIQLLSLADVGLPTDLPETGSTLEDNALQKARYAHERCGLTCLADDTGLEVEALGGAPGVLSARYAGETKDANANMVKLLSALHGRSSRSARFRTVLALVGEGEEHLFEGVVEGGILEVMRGQGGFGYDPVFVPQGYHITFAEMDRSVKNTISHRGRAVQRFLAFAEQRYR
jgi:XTP/dITP diphosphohydrolase